jgi:hypothetical protein
VTKIRIVKSRALTLHLRVRNPAGERAVTTYFDPYNSRVRQWRTLTKRGAAGEVYETSWTVGLPGAGQGGNVEPAIPLHGRLGTLVVGVAYGSTPEAAMRPALRQLFSYRVDGSSVELQLPSRPEVARRTKQGRRAWFQDSRAVANDPDAPSRLEVSVQPTAASRRAR